MTDLNWKNNLADYVRTPQFVSYGASEETRPVLVDCSLGINPLDLYPRKTIEVEVSRYARYPAHGHQIKPLADYVRSRFPTVRPDELCFGAGSQGTISSLSRVLGGAMNKILSFKPTFIPALMEFAGVGAAIETIQWPPPYIIDIDRIIAAVDDQTSLVYLDNPNNPTGQALPLAELDRLATACAKRGALLLVDEAYSDFVDDANSALFLPHSNIICVRSFSKGCGLAGARTGYMVIRDPELLGFYLKTGLLFSSSVIAADLSAGVLRELDLPAMRRRVRALKLKVMDFLAGYRQFQTAATSEDTPILFLVWAEEEGDLYDELMETGIMTEAKFYFGLEGRNAVRLRVPAEDRLDEFKRLWRRRFG